MMKYLFLLLIILFPSYAFSESKCYQLKNAYVDSGVRVSKESVCAALVGQTSANGKITASVYNSSSNHCLVDSSSLSKSPIGSPSEVPCPAFKCPDAGTPQTVFFPKGAPVPTRVCTGANGTYCSFSAKNPERFPYAKQDMVILRSDSSTSVSSCTPTWDPGKETCDPHDPYGGCYQPPDNGCTRTANGSIFCPPDAPPPKVEEGCQGGATYCKRPPGGCGTSYVSGTLNGESLCVKKGGDAAGSNTGGDKGSTDTTKNADGSTTTVNKDSAGNPTSTNVTNADGSSSSTNINKDGTSTTVTRDPQGNVTNVTSGTTNTTVNNDGSTTTTITNTDNSTTIINNNTTNNTTTTTTSNPNTGTNNTTQGTTVIQKTEVDLSGVISAINAVIDKLQWLKEELATSINEIVNKLDVTNEKIDETNQKLDQSNQSLKDIKDVLDQINNKADNQLPSSSGTPADMKGLESRLDKIASSVESIDDNLKDEPELPEDTKPTIEEHKVEGYEKTYVQWTSACPPDVQVPISLIGQSSTLVLKWSPWCDLLLKLRWAIIACAYFSAAYIILGMR